MRPKAWSGCPVDQKTSSKVSRKWNEKRQLGSCECGDLTLPHCRVWSLHGTRNKGFSFHFMKEDGSRATKVTQPGRTELGSSVTRVADIGNIGCWDVRCLKSLWALSVTGRMILGKPHHFSDFTHLCSG